MTDEKILTHIDLFSGIGGFTLAAEWAGFKTIVFCEKEKFCQKVLKKHWPEIPIIEEIRDFDGAKYRGAALLTGGFPCQPFSVAGQQKGKKDDRYLWPEMLRVIDEAKPHWILAENVPGIFRMALDTVLADLESKGYATGTFIIPACGLNAPHRRNRIWIVANSRCQYAEGTEDKGEFKRKIFEKKNASLLKRSIKDDGFGDAPDSEIGGIQGRSISIRQRQSRQPTCDIERNRQDAPDSKSRLSRKQTKQKGRKDSGRGNIEITSDTDSGRIRLYDSGGIKEGSTSRSVWQENWYEVATRFCRVDDGISDRVHRLKALGNAIVPQIAYEILKNIAWIEK